MKSLHQNQGRPQSRIKLNCTETHLCSVAVLHRQLPTQYLLNKIAKQNPSSQTMEVVKAILGLPSSTEAQEVALDFLSWVQDLDQHKAR